MPLLRSNLFLSFSLIVLAACAYWWGLGGGFIFDDYPNIVSNSLVHAQALDFASLERAATAYQPGSYGRPLATVTFAIDHAIGGMEPWGYKLSSVLVHLTNALLVFWLMLRLLALPRAGAPWSAPAAFAVALLWAVHPLQVSTVLYVVQRMETLSLTFVLLALIAYLRGRTAQMDGRNGWPWLVGAALLAGIGLLSKESAALFPAYTLALELTVLGFDAASPRTRRFLRVGYAAGVALAIVAFLAFVLPAYTAANAFSGRDFTLSERLLTQLRVLPMYLGQVVLPLPDSMPFYYDNYVVSTGWLSPATTLVGGLFLASLLGLAWYARNKLPLVALGIFWFFAAHLLTSNVFNLELVFEHRNYFALLGIVIALADLVRRIPMRDGPELKVVAVAAIILGFGLLAGLRAATWGNPLHLAMELVARNPDSPRASSDLATLYVGLSDSNPQSPLFGMGLAEFERASLLPNSSPLPEQGLILMTAATGLPVRDELWQRLIHKLRTRPVGAQERLAVAGLMKQRYDGVVMDDARLSEAYAALLARRPRAEMHAQYGDFALRYLQDEALADRQFIAAVDLARTTAPDYPAKLVGILMSEGHVRQAKVLLHHMDQLGITTGPRIQ